MRQHSANAKWLMQRYDEYRDKYGTKYVAVDRQKILDCDEDLIKLRKRIAKKHKDRPVFIQYVYKEKPALIL